MAFDTLRDRAVWRHIAVEIVIVAVGILIAFSLDSWWQGRKDYSREQTHLHALSADFQENSARLRKVVAREELVEKNAEQLLQMMRSNPDASRDEVWPLLNWVFSTTQFEPMLVAYDTLVNTGDLALIRDEELRREIVHFASTVKANWEEQFAAESYAAFRNALAGKLQMSAWGPTTGNEDAVITKRRERWSSRPLFEDPEFEDHLVVRYLQARDMKGYHSRLADQADRVVQQIANLTR